MGGNRAYGKRRRHNRWIQTARRRASISRALRRLPVRSCTYRAYAVDRARARDGGVGQHAADRISSPEPGSGKTRALEVSEILTPDPVEAVNVTPAYLFRKVGAEEGAPTILYDEIDTVFGPKAKDNEEIRGLLNAGHRRGAVAGRCVVQGKTVVTEEIPAYCAVALAGLGWLPETLLSRSIVIRMRRRAPTETIEPYRRRDRIEEGHELRNWLRAGPSPRARSCTQRDRQCRPESRIEMPTFGRRCSPLPTWREPNLWGENVAHNLSDIGNNGNSSGNTAAAEARHVSDGVSNGGNIGNGKSAVGSTDVSDVSDVSDLAGNGSGQPPASRSTPSPNSPRTTPRLPTVCSRRDRTSIRPPSTLICAAAWPTWACCPSTSRPSLRALWPPCSGCEEEARASARARNRRHGSSTNG